MSTESSHAELRTLGILDLRDPTGREATNLLAQPKRLALLTYLTVSGHGAFHRRDTLLGLFWPEVPQDRARNALNKALYFIRRSIGKDVVVSRGDQDVGIDRDRLWCDAVAFDRAIGEERLEEAVRLYRGPFLDGVYISAAPEFELWLERERERLAGRLSQALESLAVEATREGGPGDAVGWWQKLVAHDPLSTRGVLGLMTALEAAGERGAAILEAVRHTERLHRELDAGPDPSVIAFVDRLRQEPRPQPTPRPDSTPSLVLDVPPLPELPAAQPARRRSRASTAITLGLAILLAAILSSIRSASAPRAGDAIASAAGPAFAVLPFRIEDPGLELYREGMVDLLSTNLDGIGGLRAIDGKAVIRLWNEASASGASSDSVAAIEIGRRAGARFALTGSANAVGPEVRLAAEAYDVTTGERIARVAARGPADSLLQLVDRLSIDLVRAMLVEEDPGALSGARLAAVTTTSLAALKAYLEGERTYRRSDFHAAVESYERAVRADSSFALAYYRLQLATGWGSTSGGIEQPLVRAMRFVDRLPTRESWIVRALFAWNEGSPDLGLRVIRRTLQLYPDDPEAWYVMAELYSHFGGQMLARPGDDERALARAIALDPTFAPYHQHYIERAFLDADSADAAKRIAAYERIARGDLFTRAHRIAFALAFGDSTARSRARALEWSAPTEVLRRAINLLDHPRFFAQKAALIHAVLSQPDLRPDSRDVLNLFETSWAQGRMRAAREQLDSPLVDAGARAAGAYHLSLTRARLPSEWADRALSFSPPDTLGWLYAGAHAVDRKRPEDLAVIVLAARDEAERRSVVDTVRARAFAGMVTALDGYRLWRADRDREALLLLVRAQREVRGWDYINYWNMTIRLWLGSLLLELDRPEEAARYFESVWRDWEDPHAAWEVGRIREVQGEGRQALEAYRYSLQAWNAADPELAPRVDAARRAVARLENPVSRRSRRP